LRYYHYLILGVAAVTAAFGAAFSHWWSGLLYIAGVGMAASVANTLRRERNRAKAGFWREEMKSPWTGRFTGWKQNALVAGIVVLAMVTVLVVHFVDVRNDSGPQTYKDSVYGFSFEYPGSWKVGEKTSSSGARDFGIYDPLGTKIGEGYLDLAAVSAARIDPTADSSVTEAVVDQIIARSRAQLPDIALSEPLHEVVIAGASGWAWASTWTQESVSVKMVSYWLVSKEVLYLVNFKASKEHWASDGPVFDSILSTFRIP
jgi:hypothetical protein